MQGYHNRPDDWARSVRLRRKLPHGAIAIGSAPVGSPIQVATWVERQTTTLWEGNIAETVEVFAVPAVAVIRGFEDETEGAHNPGGTSMKSAGAVRPIAFSRAI